MSQDTGQNRQDAAIALDAAYAELLARAPENRVEPRLDPVRRAVELLGDVHRAAPVIHITGTNGKTSTARMIGRILRELNLHTGRFTSPHLSRVTERISLDGRPVSDETFVRMWDEIKPVLALVDADLVAAGENPLTYFEALTVLGFAVFADAPVDVVVLEVGMGGTWDSTNVADGQVSVIVPISLDHQQYLGDTIAEIAGEKAGIIKPGAITVTAVQPVEALEVLAARAAEVGADLRREALEFAVAERSVAVGGQLVSVQGLAGRYDDLFLPLHGEHQAHNLAAAIAAVEAFLGGGRQELDHALLAEAVADVTSPGRLERVHRGPTILVDAAHNPGGATVLADTLDEAFDFSRLLGVVGILGDKDARGVLEILEPAIDEVVITQSSSPRAIPAEELAALARQIFGPDRVTVQARLPDALAAAVAVADADEAEGRRGTGILVTGSITLVADARILLGTDRRAGR